jgi:hypothetical protein
MNKTAIKIVAAVPGLPMLANAVMFVFAPQQVTSDLGMPLLEGLGRSTQLGDLGAFFTFSALLIFYGVYKSEGRLLRIVALLLGLTASFRLVAWALNGAELATVLILAETILVVWLVVGANFIDRLWVSRGESQ